MLRSLICFCLLQLLLVCLPACQPEPLARPAGITLRVQFRTHQGRSVDGGWVESTHGKQQASEGRLQLLLPFNQQGQHIVVKCPLLHTGTAERHFLANTLSAGGEMEMTMLCEPIERVTSLSLHSDCKEAQIFLDDQALGRLNDGWFHAWLTEIDSGSVVPGRERPLRLVARANPGCRFIDPVTQRPASQLELTLTLSSSAQAVWTDLQGVVQPPSARRAPKKPWRRPYRL